MRYLFVCTANLCRSPLAERLAVKRGYSAASAGVYAAPGMAMHRLSAQVLNEVGGDADNFASRRFTPELAKDADLILAMTAEHRELIIERAPVAWRRVYTLGEAARLTRDSGATTVSELALARAGIQPLVTDDIPDPIGMEIEAFREVATLVDSHIETITSAIAMR